MYSHGAPGLRDMLFHILNSWIVLSSATSMHKGSGCRNNNRPSARVNSVPYTLQVTARMPARGFRYGVALGATGAGATGHNSLRSSSHWVYSSRVLGMFRN